MSTHGRARQPMTAWVGWIAFAAVLMVMSGLFNVVTGISGIAKNDIYVTGARGVLVLDVTAWGWIHLLLGVLLLGTGIALLGGAVWARLIAIVLVMLNMLTQLFVLPSYPFWALLIIALDVVVLWAIVVHGEELESS